MNRRGFLLTAASPFLLTMRTPLSSAPSADITNGLIQATLYLPDPEKGFYRSTRFDWSGVIASLKYADHDFYGPWYTDSDPPVRDFEYRGSDIVTGAQSTITGPAEEFPSPQGYQDAKPGETFVKIGVGVLRRIDDSKYNPYANYEIVDSGTWTSRPRADAVEFQQEVMDPASGYGYRYQKTVRLVEGQPELIIGHRLTNIGKKPIRASQYNHNFLVLDGATTGPDFLITVPFQIKTNQPPDPALAEVRGNTIAFNKVLAGEDRVYIPIDGFTDQVSDYDVTVANQRTGASVRITADRPMVRMALWSIRSNISIEPFVDASTNPGDTTTWTLRYMYGAS
ncbi:MAG: hypothetical protein KTR29_23625 [Rhodothermaceae bacterium]|nr:hypothetical protein [Rhodothermaceae bacterium]